MTTDAHPIYDVLGHPGFRDPSWRDEAGRDLYDALAHRYGPEKASAMWNAACDEADQGAEEAERLVGENRAECLHLAEEATQAEAPAGDPKEQR